MGTSADFVSFSARLNVFTIHDDTVINVRNYYTFGCIGLVVTTSDLSRF